MRPIVPARIMSIFFAAMLGGTSLGVPIGAGEPSSIDAVESAIKEGRYADAEKVARKLLEEVNEAHGSESEEAAEVLRWLVEALRRNGKWGAPETMELAERGIAIAERLYGPDDLRLARHLNNLGDIYMRRRKLDRARPYVERVVAIREKILGPDHPEVAAALNNLGGFHVYSENPEEARPILERSIRIYEAAYGEEHPDLIFPIGSLAGTLYYLGDYDASKELGLREVGLIERFHGPEHPLLGTALSNLGGTLIHMRDPAGAVPYLEHALKIKEASLGPDHPSLSYTLGRLGQAMGMLEEWARARAFDERSLAIRIETFGPDHPQVAISLTNFGASLIIAGDNRGAIERLERALVIAKDHYGASHPVMVEVLANIAVARENMGDYVSSRALHERVLDILEKTLGPDDPRNAMAHATLATLLRTLGDYDAAESRFKRAVQILEKAHGPDDPDVARVLKSLAATVQLTGRYDEARALYARALKIWEKHLGSSHLEAAVIYQNLAIMHVELEEFEEAARLSRRAGEIWEKEMGVDHFQVAECLEVIAHIDRVSGKLASAIELHRRILQSRKETHGRDHPAVASSMNNLAALSWEMGDSETALDMALDAERIVREHFVRTARSLAEREALSYESVRDSGLDVALSVLVQRAAKPPPHATIARVWDELVRSRGMVLDEFATRHRTSLIDPDPDMVDTVRDLRSARNRLAALVVEGPDTQNPEGYRERLSKAVAEKERLERSLAALSREFRDTLSRQAIGLEEVSVALPPGSTLVAYVRFDRHPPVRSDEDGSASPADQVPWYVALVLNSGGKEPDVVSLGASDELEILIHHWREAVGTEPQGLPLAGSQSETTYRSIGGRLREVIWDRVAGRLRGSGTVFIVPDGAINTVNIAALPMEPGGYVLEGDRRLHYLSTERDLIRDTHPREAGKGLLALGGPDFEASVDEIRASALDGLGPDAAGRDESTVDAGPSSPYRSPAPACGDFASLSFDPLPGSAAEVEEIESLWPRSTNPIDGGIRETLLLSGPAANESAFKRWAPGRRVLHLATHGFFLDDRCESFLRNSRSERPGYSLVTEPFVPLLGDNPLLLAGLALAGANNRRGSLIDTDSEDGILTAEEIASLDLTSVDWAVLSACETGLGTIKPGEGVLGLRRAFETAGVGTLIMSLWKVQDDSSRKWMRNLYEGRRNGLSTVEAVREASLAVIESRRSDGKSTHPFYWGAFIAAGDWR